MAGNFAAGQDVLAFANTAHITISYNAATGVLTLSGSDTIAAYNAGEAAVDRWEREIVTDDIEEFVERIPYVETRGYVKLVLRNHQIYKRLYDTQK